MIQNKKKKQHNRSLEFISNIILPCTADLGETLKRILERHRIRIIFKPIIKLTIVLSLGKIPYPQANVEASFVKSHMGNVNTNTLDKRSEA